MMYYEFLRSRKGSSDGRIGTPLLLKPLLLTIGLLAGAIPGRLSGAPAVEVPVIKGDLGPCSANFTVVDSNNKPIHDSKVQLGDSRPRSPGGEALDDPSASYGGARRQALFNTSEHEGAAKVHKLPTGTIGHCACKSC